MQQYRQGDVLLELVSELPEHVKEIVGPVILAYGEVTGHHHLIKSNTAKLFETKDETRFVKLKNKSKLVHQEHDIIEIPRGVYQVTIQREYHPERIRNVQD